MIVINPVLEFYKIIHDESNNFFRMVLIKKPVMKVVL